MPLRCGGQSLDLAGCLSSAGNLDQVERCVGGCSGCSTIGSPEGPRTLQRVFTRPLFLPNPGYTFCWYVDCYEQIGDHNFAPAPEALSARSCFGSGTKGLRLFVPELSLALITKPCLWSVLYVALTGVDPARGRRTVTLFKYVEGGQRPTRTEAV